MRIDLYADVVCPWCYIGRAGLGAALARLGDPSDVTVRFRSYLLHPDAHHQPQPLGAALAARYGSARVAEMLATITERGRDVGLRIALDPVESLTGNTMAAHRLIQGAWDAGVQPAVADAVLAAHFAERRSIFDEDELSAIGIGAGMTPLQVDGALHDAGCAQRVSADSQHCSRLGITAVPFIVIDGRHGIQGAQPVPVLVEILERLRDRPAA